MDADLRPLLVISRCELREVGIPLLEVSPEKVATSSSWVVGCLRDIIKPSQAEIL